MINLHTHREALMQIPSLVKAFDKVNDIIDELSTGVPGDFPTECSIQYKGEEKTVIFQRDIILSALIDQRTAIINQLNAIGIHV